MLYFHYLSNFAGLTLHQPGQTTCAFATMAAALEARVERHGQVLVGEKCPERPYIELMIPEDSQRKTNRLLREGRLNGLYKYFLSRIAFY